jgi:dolichyl-phosphate-mannose--protein O-mannosyl transferase
MRTPVTAVLLCLLSFALFFRDIGNPPGFLLDESQYVGSANALLAHTPNTNPEAPPLGKLLIAVGIKSFGNNPLGWRIMSVVFGAFTLAGLFLWVRLLVEDYSIALIAALLTLLNNFLFVFARAALMDIFLVGFLIFGLLAFTAALKLNNISAAARRVFFLLSGVLFGFSCACKWNGVDTLGVAVVTSIGLLWLSRRSSNPEIASYAEHLRQAGTSWVALSLLFVPVVAYSITFIPLFHSLHHPFSLRELVSMNIFIWKFHREVVGNVFLVTRWYNWPLHVEPLRSLSYLVGNWYIMWAGLLALLLCARRFGKTLPETLIVLLYACNFLQWAFTPQSCMFYYYYFPSAVFLGVAIPLAFRQLPERVFGVRLGALSVLPALVIFAYCYQRMAHLQPPFDCALGCWP